MAVSTREVIEDLVSALRAGGSFAEVSLGPSPAGTAVPRATVTVEGEEFFTPDDDPAGRWVRLRIRVAIRTRSQDGAEGALRLSDLCRAVAEAILADPYRGGRCRDLPIGRATEVERVQPAGDLARPEVGAALAVRCHLELPPA